MTSIIPLLISLLFLSTAHAAPVDDSSLKSFITNDATGELSSLLNEFEKFTPADIAYLRKVVLDRDAYADDNDLLNTMKADAPETYEKVIRLLKPFYDRMKKLNTEAQQFFVSVTSDIGPSVTGETEPSIEQLATVGFKVAARYETISDEAKASINAQFPFIHKGFTFLSEMKKTLAAFDM